MKKTKTKVEKTKYTHKDEWHQIPSSKKKLVLLVLMYFNEAGNREDAIKLIRNRWVRKIYPLPRPNHNNYNSKKAIRSQYWRKLNSIIDEYIIEVV
ncbi:hypothetical protein DFQ09_11059 [Winogradskyella pacifica]|uniref:Uncharacterized protein n=1 Tax=Winogradskyella pacifica TaxID=664642 RepID=A0A3D9LKT3_9FLAO|nr:hypothetical protein [Winogradskyella pacifica]REE07865.1 hypothetical protein DFQ09_11059 [Winogradskyella pacifica]